MKKILNSFIPSLPRKAIRYFVLAYWVVTILGILLTIAFMYIFRPPSPQELGVPFSQAPAYLMTLPYHPLLIPHPWAMMFKEFYVDYQPWITLVYLVIFFAPIVASKWKDISRS